MTCLVTGGTGSLGSRLVRRILQDDDVSKVIVYSRNEANQVVMARELQDSRVRYVMGDIRDDRSIARALRGVDYCIHTAALKHVDKAEYSPGEYIDVNINGTASVVEACDRVGVKRMVLVSTDKAVQPVNLYGATKMCAEKLVLAACAQNHPRYSVVRYGNVLDSAGSALLLFREMVKRGTDALPVTDETMTRFAMTFTMAMDLIGQALRGPPQVVYVAKAKSFRVLDLCYALDRRILRIGPRPGEKQHEVLVSKYESTRATDWGNHIRIAPQSPADDSIDYTGGTPMEPGMEYCSGTTRDRLTTEELKAWCNSTH